MMATISFDRKMRLREEDVPRFIEATSKPSQTVLVPLDIDKELAEGRLAFENAFRISSRANRVDVGT